MARKPSHRVVLNRSCIVAIGLGLADGSHAAGEAALEAMRPNVPDAPPLGRGLVRTGRVATYVDGRQVAGSAPGSARRYGHRDAGIVTVIGWGFPSRFLVLGTVHIAPHDWFTPGMQVAVVSQGADYIVEATNQRLRRVRP